MADETLLYTASFDPTGIIQGEAVAAKAFSDLDRSAAKAFNNIGQSAEVAKRSLFQVGTVGKGTGMAMQQAGYQVGDFFVQLASGQGVIRPLIQQSTQMLQVFGVWGSLAGAAAAIMGSLYVALNRTKDAAKELSATDLPDWMSDRSVLIAVRYDLEALEMANAGLATQINASNQAVSVASSYLIAYSADAKKAAEAAFQFKKLVGMSPEEFKEKVGKFATFNEYVTDATARANAHLFDLQSELAQEQAKAKENELDKLLGMESIGYAKSVLSQRAYYTAIRDDVKKSDAERAKAKKDLTDALELVEKIHNQRVANITGQYTEKETEKRNEQNKKAADDAKREKDRLVREEAATFKAMASARQSELDELRKFQDTRADIMADLDIRATQGGGDDVSKLEANQARERQALKKRLDDQVKNLDLSIKDYEEYYSALDRLAAIHAIERERIVAEESSKNKKALTDAAKDAARAWQSLGATIADTFGIGPLKTFLTWLEKIVSVAEDLATIKRTSSILGGLLGLGAGAGAATGLSAGFGEGASLLPLLALAKNNQSVPNADYTPPGALAKANSTQQGTAGAASYTFGDINVHVPQGTPMQGIAPMIKLAVTEAAEQIERNRNQKTFANGTFHF